MIKGTVLSTKGERAKVRINFKLTDEKGLRAYVDCWNPISAHPGDNVTIEYRKIDEKRRRSLSSPCLSCVSWRGSFRLFRGELF